ncbi:MAG: hypothetical protein FWD22_02410 [Treponema sp.]|nr:hypothetical protein [Treponema sp.]
MIRRLFLSLFLLIFVFFHTYAQGHEQWHTPYVIRGEVVVDLEPIYAGYVDIEYPLSIPSASRRALEEMSMLFSAMIYGWTFNYEVGERARRIPEVLELEQIGSIKYGDPALQVTETEIRDMTLRVWADYNLNDSQQRRMQVWRTGMIRNAQATGYGPVQLNEYPGWLAIKQTALEDAARAALRASLRGSERNRPKQVTGFISLASFPRYYIDAGRWAVFARFRMQITEIIPFSAY